jgi:hypothetical protein
MSRERLTLLVLALTVAPAGDGLAKPVGRNGLVAITAPSAVGLAAAHPWVNIRVGFGSTTSGVPADPQTFRARLGRTDITALFKDFVDKGQLAKQAAVGPPDVKVGRGRVNRLRIMVRSVPIGARRRRVRDVDRFRFRAEEAPNQPPVAALGPSSEVILPGIPMGFDGTASLDPDADLLTYHWDFGDGTDPSSEPRPAHVFDEGGADRTIRLTVSDGQLTATDQVTLFALPPLDPGRTPGVHQLVSSRALELGAVPPGASASTTFTVRNTDATPTSQLKVRLGTDRPDFTLDKTGLDLGPGQEDTVTLTFTPSGAGHRTGNLTLVASASNRPVTHLLGHGFGDADGRARDAGPTLADEPVFSNVGGNPFAILMNGERVPVNAALNRCVRADGSGGLTLCVGPQDCDTPGETCSPALTTPFPVVDLCADGQGGLNLLSEPYTYTDPGGNFDRSASVLRLQLDPNANRIGAAMLARTTDETVNIACDHRPGGDGRVFIAQFEELDTTSCFHDEREVLTGIRRTTGATVELLAPIDRVANQDPCEGDFDPVGDLEVSRDGSSIFASFQSGAGIYRVEGPPPTPLQIVQGVGDAFQVHPDGAILYARADDLGATGFIRLYKIFPEQSLSGALPLGAHSPCATFKLPNNQGFTRLGDSLVLDVPRPIAASANGVVLVSFGVSEVGTQRVIGSASPLRVRGTVAFASPFGESSCTDLGLVTAEPLDPLTF